MRQLVREWSIECDFQDCTSFLYAVGAPGPLEEEHDACLALGMDVFLTRDTELPFAAQALGLRNQACFHPLRLLAALAEGLTVCEHSRVLTVEEHALSTEHGSVSAEHIVFACHYPFINMPGYYFTRQHQERSYVLALKGTENLQNYYLGIDGEGLSFRSWGTHCYWAAEATARGENREGGKYALLEQAARRYWPDCRVAARWSAQDCMPMDGVPYLGVFADSRPSWLVATGFQKVGHVLLCDCGGAAAGPGSGADAASGSLRIFSSPLPPERLCQAAGRGHASGRPRLSRQLWKPGRIPLEELPLWPRGHCGD